MRFHSLIILFLFAHLSAVTVAAAAAWPESELLATISHERDVKSPKVIKIAKFAINEQNKRSKAKLKLVKILRCTENVYTIDNSFSLELLAKHGTRTTKKYLAHLFETKDYWFRPSTNQFELESFELAQ
ncbi:hypothetical protein HN51_003888 [Arachis hypogaea]|uniref:Cystatin domain-containing protein n=1 Tax=Arachis hypogaea TaxID=3818 RepID=A0A445DJP5_ARAHY|nr:hypothetical protein Ahy_A04g021108 [Arachis hypogaea]